MAETRARTGPGTANRRGRVGGTARREHEGEAPRKKNLRLHQSKIDEAKEILGTATETETIEVALDLVVFRQELVEGVRAMRGARLADVFAD